MNSFRNRKQEKQLAEKFPNTSDRPYPPNMAKVGNVTNDVLVEAINRLPTSKRRRAVIDKIEKEKYTKSREIVKDLKAAGMRRLALALVRLIPNA